MTKYLFPHYYKRIGIYLMIIGTLGYFFIGITHQELKIPWLQVYDSGLAFAGSSADHFFKISTENILDELIAICMIAGCVLATFAKETNEDEFIAKLRLESLVWAIYLNYGVLFILILTVYGLDFLYIMQINMCALLVTAFLRFNYILYKSRRAVENE